MSTSVATAEQQQIVSADERNQRMVQWLARLEPQLERALAGAFDPQEFARICLTAFKQTPKLQDCTPTSFLGAVVEAAQMKLPPNTPLGWSYIIPRKGKAQFQLGYKGIIQLMYRSKMVRAVRANVVREGEHHIWRDGLSPLLEHEPKADRKAARLAAWAVVDLVGGGQVPAWLWAEDVEAIRNRHSEAFKHKAGPWAGADHEQDWMWMKTAIVRAGKLAPLEIQILRAIGLDEQADSEQGQDLTAPIDVDFDVVEDGKDYASQAEAFVAENEPPEHEAKILKALEQAGLEQSALEDYLSAPLIGSPPEIEEQALRWIKNTAKKGKK